jgi:hypothetical protein
MLRSWRSLICATLLTFLTPRLARTARRLLTGIRQMNAPIRPPSSSLVQESVGKCEVVHTWENNLM